MECKRIYIKELLEASTEIAAANIPTDHLHSIHWIEEDEKPIARAALYINPDLGDSQFLLGAYQCPDDSAIANKLLLAVEEEAKLMGAKKLVGPMNGSTWESYRFAVSSETESFLLEPDQPDYYISQWESIGFKSAHEYHSSIAKIPNNYKEKELHLDNNFSIKNISWRAIESDELMGRLPDLAKFTNETFKESDFFTPLQEDQFILKYKQLLNFIPKSKVLVAEENGLIVSFLFSYLDKDRLIVKTLSRKKGSQYKFLASWLCMKLLNWAKTENINTLIHALVKSNNVSLQKSAEFGGRTYKNYYLFEKSIV